MSTKKWIKNQWKKQKSYKEIHYLPRGIVPVALVIGFIISDYTFISQLLEFYFYDAAWRGILASFVIAVLIDVTPAIIAACLMIPQKEKIHHVGIAALSGMLAVIFGFLGYVRLNSADLIFSIGSSSLISASGKAAEQTITPGQSGMSWLFVVLPIGTSILSFVIGIVSDSRPDEEYAKKCSEWGIENEIICKEAAKIELMHILDNDFDAETDAKYELAVSDNRANRDLVFDRLLLNQAFACGNPQAATEILEKKKG